MNMQIFNQKFIFFSIGIKWICKKYRQRILWRILLSRSIIEMLG